MNKHFRAAALLTIVAVSSLAISSCNNGLYDADPTTNNSNVGNPFNQNNGGLAALGTITAKLDGNKINFTSANYLDTLGSVLISGMNGAVPNFSQLDLNILSYSGVKKYEDLNGPDQLNLTYIQLQNLAFNFFHSTDGTHSKITIDVTEEQDNTIKGTFSGILYYNDLTGAENVNNKIEVTEGSFYVKKAGT